MPKSRPSVPKLIKDAVLAEYRHRCAVCGGDSPHLHHIDEVPDHNEPRNLLPLCPNCHLTDQHHPSRAIAQQRLQLFRDYKDPTILWPQFEPLYQRALFLLNPPDNLSSDVLRKATDDLVAFVREMKSGNYYASRLAALLQPPTVLGALNVLDDASIAESRRIRLDEHRKRIGSNRAEAIQLVVELLRYQEWANPHGGNRRPRGD